VTTEFRILVGKHLLYHVYILHTFVRKKSIEKFKKGENKVQILNLSKSAVYTEEWFVLQKAFLNLKNRGL
jgi:hypothetical protein